MAGLCLYRPYLAARDVREAVRFYCAAFGWTFRPKHPRSNLVAWLDGEGSPAVCVPFEGADGSGGWYPVFTVAELGVALPRATALGAEVLIPPRELDGNAFAALASPGGEIFGVVQPSPEHAALGSPAGTWLEAVTCDAHVAEDFYRGLFGWTVEWYSDGYRVLKRDGRAFAGLLELNDNWDDAAFLTATGRGSGLAARARPHFVTYLRVQDLDEVVDKVQFLGGAVFARNESIPGVGRFAIARDSSGNYVSFVETSAGR